MTGYVPKSFVPDEAASSAPSGGYVPKSFVPDEPEAKDSGFADTVRAGLQGVYGSLGLDAGEVAAAWKALPAVTNPSRNITEEYEAALREYKPDIQRAAAEHPVAKSIGEIAPAMAAPASVPLQAGIGAVRGFATSDKTGAGRLGDAALDAGLSAVGTKVSNSIAGWAAKGPLARWLGGKAAQANASGLAARAAAKAAEEASAQGAIGSKAADVMRSREILMREAGNVAPELATEAESKLGSDAMKARLEAAYRNYLGRADQGIADIAALEEKRAAAQAIDPVAEWAGRSSLGGTVKNVIAPRLKTLATRGIPAYVGQKVGSEVGGTEGQVIGGLAGLGAGLTMGNPGTTIANMLKSPEFRVQTAGAARAGLKAAGAGAGRLARLLGVTSDDEAQALIRRFADEQQ